MLSRLVLGVTLLTKLRYHHLELVIEYLQDQVCNSSLENFKQTISKVPLRPTQVEYILFRREAFAVLYSCKEWYRRLRT
jgi:hypothetical protein